MTLLEHNDEDRTKAALVSLAEKEDYSFKRLVVRLSAIRCRTQSSKCRRLVPFAQSEAEATVLKGLSLSWTMLANQTARYDEMMEIMEGPAQKQGRFTALNAAVNPLI